MGDAVVRQIFYGLAAASGVLLMGCSLGASLPNDHEIKRQLSFQDKKYGMSNWWVRACLPLSALVFVIIAAISTRYRGPTISLRIAALGFFLAYLLLISYFYNNENRSDYDLLCAYRILLGLCCGFVTLALPICTTDIAQNEIRGALGCLLYLNQLIGQLAIYSVLIFGDFYWIYIGGFFPAVLFVISVYAQIYSPVYLIRSGYEDDAIEVLEKLRGRSYDFGRELENYRAMARENGNRSENFWQRIRRPSSQRALLICVGLMFFHNFTGIHTVLLETTPTFQQADLFKKEYVLVAVLAIQITSTLIALSLVDTVGRRLLLLISSGVMSLCMLLLVLDFLVQPKGHVLSTTALLIFVIGFSFGFGPIPWIYMGELLSFNVREYAAALVAASFWVFHFIEADLFIILKSHKRIIGYSYCLYSLFSIMAFLFVYMLVPETKREGLLDIQDQLVESDAVEIDVQSEIEID